MYHFQITLKESFETEYGYAPKWTPLLEFNNKLLYATTAALNDRDEFENQGIGIVDLSKQQVQYEKFDNHDSDYFPLFSSDEHAYILGKTFELFKNLPQHDW